MTPITKPIFSYIDPLGGTRVISYNPGIPVYSVAIANNHDRAIAVSISYDIHSGEVRITVQEKGV